MVQGYIQVRYPIEGITGADDAFRSTQREKRRQLRSILSTEIRQRYLSRLQERIEISREHLKNAVGIEIKHFDLPPLFRALVQISSKQKNMSEIHYWTDDNEIRAWIEQASNISSILVDKARHPIDMQLKLYQLQWNRTIEDREIPVPNVLKDKMQFLQQYRMLYLNIRRSMVGTIISEDVRAIWRPSGAVWCESVASNVAAVGLDGPFATLILQHHSVLFHSVVLQLLLNIREQFLHPVLATERYNTQRLRITRHLVGKADVNNLENRVLQMFHHMLPVPILQAALLSSENAENQCHIKDMLEKYVNLMELCELLWLRLSHRTSTKRKEGRQQEKQRFRDAVPGFDVIADVIGKEGHCPSIGPGQAAINAFIVESVEQHYFHSAAMECVLKQEFASLFNSEHYAKIAKMLEDAVERVMLHIERLDPTVQFLDRLIKIVEQQIEITDNT